MKRPTTTHWLATALLGLLAAGCAATSADAEHECEAQDGACCAADEETAALAAPADSVVALEEEVLAEEFERPRLRYYVIADT